VLHAGNGCVPSYIHMIIWAASNMLPCVSKQGAATSHALQRIHARGQATATRGAEASPAA
jgi:hypothetical protein